MCSNPIAKPCWSAVGNCRAASVLLVQDKTTLNSTGLSDCTPVRSASSALS